MTSDDVFSRTRPSQNQKLIKEGLGPRLLMQCLQVHAFFYPTCACAARGKVISRDVLVVSTNLHFFWNQSFISQNTHFQRLAGSEVSSSTSLRGQIVCSLGKGLTMPETQTLHQCSSKPYQNQRLQTTPRLNTPTLLLLQ